MTTCRCSSRRPEPGVLLHVLECVPVVLLVLLLCPADGSGFAVHHRHPHPHHHARHQGHHHPMSPESTVSPERAAPTSPAAAEALAVDALLEAVKAAELNDAAWGPVGSGDKEEAVPLFMKLLLRDTELGTIYNEYSQPVAAPAAGALSNKTLASCEQPSRVSVGRAGAMVVEFPRDNGGDGNGGWWLVLSPQPSAATLPGAVLSVYMSASEDLTLLAEHPLPNATFLAVDVTKAMNGTDAPWTRFVVDVTSARSAPGLASAATALEVAGWERGPLLVRALDWGQDTTSRGPGVPAGGSGGIRVWSDVPEDLAHPARVRTRRRSHRTKSPAFSSAEDQLQSAARTEIKPDSGEQETRSEGDGDVCHLEPWTVSLDDLGWNFIVEPRQLDLNFCVGRCPTPLHERRFNASMNAIARTFIKLERGAEAGAHIPDAQCVPIRFKPIALLMRKNGGGIDLFHSYDLSADRCGCR